MTIKKNIKKPVIKNNEYLRLHVSRNGVVIFVPTPVTTAKVILEK